jgi:hypothetical protein
MRRQDHWGKEKLPAIRGHDTDLRLSGIPPYGKQGCEGWQVLESSVTQAVVPFMADMLENKLGLRQYVEEEARNMVLEQQGDRMKRLKGQVEAARSQLKRVQEMTVQGLLRPEEAKPFIYEARETIERGQSQLGSLEKTLVLQRELADAVSEVCADIPGALQRLDRPALQAIVRQVFTQFTIGKQRRYQGKLDTWIESYEFRPEIQDLLAQGVHIGESHRSVRPSLRSASGTRWLSGAARVPRPLTRPSSTTSLA